MDISIVSHRGLEGITHSESARGAPNGSRHRSDDVRASAEQQGTRLNQPEADWGYRLQAGYRQRVPQGRIGPVRARSGVRFLRRSHGRRAWARRGRTAQVTVCPFQVSPSGGVIAGFGIREIGSKARGQPPEIHCDFEQASQPAEIDQLVGAPLLMTSERLPSEVKPQSPSAPTGGPRRVASAAGAARAGHPPVCAEGGHSHRPGPRRVPRGPSNGGGPRARDARAQ